MADYDPFFPVFSPHHTGTSRNAGIQRLSADPLKWSLYDAVSLNRLDAVQRLLSSPGRHDLQEIAGALRLTGQRGYVDIGRFLLSRTRIQVDAHCPDGYTALVLASRQGHDDMVQMCIDHGADASRAVYRTKVSAMHWAAVNGHTRCVEVLLRAGAPADVHTLQRRTPLMLAACYGHQEVVKILLKATNAEHVSHADVNGMTALHMAVMEGHEICADLLLEAGADIDAQNLQGYTPLLMAVERGHSEIVFSLIQAEANLELSLYHCQCRAIHLAIALERHDICSYLINGGCSLEAKCQLVQSCLDVVVLHGNVTALHLAATGRDEAILALILDKLSQSGRMTESLLFSSTSDGYSPLMLAATFGSEQVLIELFKRYKLLRRRPEDFLADISLAVASTALRGRLHALKILLRNSSGDLPRPRIEGLTTWPVRLNQSRLTPDMVGDLTPADGHINDGVLDVLMVAANCDEIIRALVELLPDDTATVQRIAYRFSVPGRLERLCVAKLRRCIAPQFDRGHVADSLALPPTLLRNVTLQYFDVPLV